jgi:hypothetical protein
VGDPPSVAALRQALEGERDPEALAEIRRALEGIPSGDGVLSGPAGSGAGEDP